MKKKIFINAGLSSVAERDFNHKIKKICLDCGFELYMPQEALPPGKSISSQLIFKANMNSILASDYIISVLDKPGLGVAYELGFARAMNKEIIIFRSDSQDYLGKILEGFWESIPDDRKAKTLFELKKILLNLGEKRWSYQM